ncbi:MAG: hypothetical protein KF729_38825, partial [Sandaracinaceae bacterium]|nr:hypothetical protein [Sandaracinaceae bacterium]
MEVDLDPARRDELDAIPERARPIERARRGAQRRPQRPTPIEPEADAEAEADAKADAADPASPPPTPPATPTPTPQRFGPERTRHAATARTSAEPLGRPPPNPREERPITADLRPHGTLVDVGVGVRVPSPRQRRADSAARFGSRDRRPPVSPVRMSQAPRSVTPVGPLAIDVGFNLLQRP